MHFQSTNTPFIRSLFFGVACLHGPSLKGATIVNASRKRQNNAWEQPATYHSYEHTDNFRLCQGCGPQEPTILLSVPMNDKPTKRKDMGNVDECENTKVAPSHACH